MDRTIVWSASMTGAVCALFAWTGYRVHAADRATTAALEERVNALAARLEEPRDARIKRDEPETGLDVIEARVEELRMRVARLERPPRVAVVEEATAPVAVAPDDGAVGDAAHTAEFEALLSRMIANGWDFSRSSDEYERFLELARSTDLLDARIDELVACVAASPEDIELRLALARSYEGKLMTVAGPEQGLWGGRAEEPYLAIVELDDGHWTSHAWLGTNYSYYPEVMGKTADALEHLERARELQRSMQPDLEHVRTYLFLARMYERDGKLDAARDALDEGLSVYPGNAELETALARLQ